MSKLYQSTKPEVESWCNFPIILPGKHDYGHTILPSDDFLLTSIKMDLVVRTDPQPFPISVRRADDIIAITTIEPHTGWSEAIFDPPPLLEKGELYSFVVESLDVKSPILWRGAELAFPVAVALVSSPRWKRYHTGGSVGGWTGTHFGCSFYRIYGVPVGSPISPSPDESTINMPSMPETVALGDFEEERYEYYTIGADGAVGLSTGSYRQIGQIFIPERDHWVTRVRLPLSRSGNPGHCLVGISPVVRDKYGNSQFVNFPSPSVIIIFGSSGVVTQPQAPQAPVESYPCPAIHTVMQPMGYWLDGGFLNIARGCFDADSLSPDTWADIPLSPAKLKAGRHYFLSLAAPESNAWNKVNWAVDSSDASYPRGGRERHSDGGYLTHTGPTTWYYPKMSFLFEEWGVPDCPAEIVVHSGQTRTLSIGMRSVPKSGKPWDFEEGAQFTFAPYMEELATGRQITMPIFGSGPWFGGRVAIANVNCVVPSAPGRYNICVDVYEGNRLVARHRESTVVAIQ